jgi:hypothetical protein
MHIMKQRQDIQGHISESDEITSLLQKLKQENTGIKTPEGYFETLSPRIVDSITQQNRSKVTYPLFRKPIVWAPVMATIATAVLLIFFVPSKKVTSVPATDEWSEMVMGYDASYAEEVLFTESFSIYNEIDKSETVTESASLSNNTNVLTDDEISTYLKDQNVDIEMITEY